MQCFVPRISHSSVCFEELLRSAFISNFCGSYFFGRHPQTYLTSLLQMKQLFFCVCVWYFLVVICLFMQLQKG